MTRRNQKMVTATCGAKLRAKGAAMRQALVYLSICHRRHFHRAMVATVPGDKLLIGRRPVRNWTRRTISSLFLCRKLHLFLGKSTKTAATTAALFDSNMHQIVCRLRLQPRPHCESLQQAAKLVAALLRVAGGNCGPGGMYWQPTTGFMTHITCRLSAKNQDQLRNPMLGNQVWATFTFIHSRPKG